MSLRPSGTPLPLSLASSGSVLVGPGGRRRPASFLGGLRRRPSYWARVDLKPSHSDPQTGGLVSVETTKFGGTNASNNVGSVQ